MLKELTPHITAGMSLNTCDDDFTDTMLDYMVDAVIELLNQSNVENGNPGRWVLEGPDLYYNEEVQK